MDWCGVGLCRSDVCHLNEEETVVFMLAESFLQPAEQAELAAKFKGFEVAKAASDRHRQIHTMPEELLGEKSKYHLPG